MKGWMATAAALALLTGITAANAQNAPAANNDQSTKTTQQQTSAERSTRPATRKHARVHVFKPRRHASIKHRYTTGSSSQGGVQYDQSIHQSKQRDSRGTPKGAGPDQFK